MALEMRERRREGERERERGNSSGILKIVLEI